MDRQLAVIIMAAGKGTRMNNPEIPKVMYPINGKPMIDYAVNVAASLGPAKIIVVVGWQKESIVRHLEGLDKSVAWVEQSPQLGTGHAVMQAEKELAGFEGDVLVLSGDVPLLSSATLSLMLGHHRTTRAHATVLTAILEEPSGYGRIIRDPDGSVRAIIEHKDASDAERRVKEINSGIYVFDNESLFRSLKHITRDNVQKEYYLTDVFGYFHLEGLTVSAVPAVDPREIMGINTPQHLEEARTAITNLVDNQK